MSFEQRNADSCKAQTDVQMAYIDAERRVNQLKVENAKLVDVLHEVEAEAVYAYHCLQQDCVTTANSSEHFFKKWWHAECELDRLNAENAKLRELARKIYGGYLGGHYMISCNGCKHAYEDCGGYVPLDPDCCVFSDSARYVGCWKRKRLEAEMRELGVEVTE